MTVMAMVAVVMAMVAVRRLPSSCSRLVTRN
jgi:hypothetical protein